MAKPGLETLMQRAKLVGSDRAYLLWLRSQPSAIDGQMDYDRDTGQRWCVPAHYRTAANSGTGCKPEYSAIPLTHAQHLEQHRIGQFNFKSRSWWQKQVRIHLTRWIKERTK